MFSDGCKYFDGKNYHFRLNVNDKEYAEAFGENLAEVLEKNRPYKPFWDEDRKQWVVMGYSILLYRFLNRPLEELKPYIEHCKDCVASFLQALFDGDGSIYVKIRGRRRERKLRLYNTNKELLVYIQCLLRRFFNINTRGPHLTTRKGSIKHFPNDKKYTTTENYYYIYIHVSSLSNFYKYIGFFNKAKTTKINQGIASPLFLIDLSLHLLNF
jgi:intein-encoded DNA endonuclease-like protein